MPYSIQSECQTCSHSDTFIIGNWTEHYGVYICRTCRQLVNISVADGVCKGCGSHPNLTDYYDYSHAIPYLGGQNPMPLESGPNCPRCEMGSLTFHNQAHLNLGMVVHNTIGAQSTWGIDTMEKSIFMNSAIPVIQEFQLDPVKVFTYFHLHIPNAPLMTRRVSFPIAIDIRTHLFIQVMTRPGDFKSGPI